MSNQSPSKKVSPQTGTAFERCRHWVVLRRRLVQLTSAGIVFAIIGAIVVFATFEPEYEATHILQANHDFVLSKDFGEGTKDLARNARLIVLSPGVLDDVLDSPKLKSVPSLKNQETREVEIRKRIKINNGATDGIFMISYRDTDKNQVAEVVNEIAEGYKNERKRYDDQRLKNLEQSLTQPINQARRNIEEARRHYEDLSKKVHGVSPSKSSPDSLDAESTLSQGRRALDDLDIREGSSNATLVGKQAELASASQLNSEGLVTEEDRLAKLGVETADLVFASKKLEYETKYYDKLNSRRLALRAEQEKASSITSQSIAKPPAAPIEGTPTKKILMASAIAFMIPYLLALVIELLPTGILRGFPPRTSP